MVEKNNWSHILRYIFGGATILAFVFLALTINEFLLDNFFFGYALVWQIVLSWAVFLIPLVILLIKIVNDPLDTLESMAVIGAALSIVFAMGLVCFAIGSLSILLALLAIGVAGIVALLIYAMSK